MREDWIEVELGEVCENAESVKRKDITLSDTFKYFDIGGIDNKTNKIVSYKEYSWENAPSRAQQIIKEGDVLFSTVRTYLKNIAQVDKAEYDNQICSSGFTVLRGIADLVVSNYIFYYSLSLGFLNPLSALQTGSSYPAVRDKDVFAQIFPLAPLPIQRAIVSKIEALFSDLDNGIANFKTAQEQLKIYRQAVLKKAFEGELTKEWREKQSNLPTAEELLKQIKEERQNHYNQQIEDWKKAVKEWEKNGKKEKKPSKPKKIEELQPLNDKEKNELSDLPDGWTWTSFSNLGFWTGGGTPSKAVQKYWDSGNILWITSKDMKTKVIYDSMDKITATAVENSSAKLINKGSVLFVMRSGILRRILPVAITNSESTVNQDLQAITPFLNNSEFIYWYSVANEFNIRKKCAKDGTTVESVESTLLKRYPISICSIAEQTQIVAEIESRLSVTDNLEFVIRNSIEKAEALRQSILKKAFEGKLLSAAEIAQCKQEADYEPASELLKKIKAEKLAKEQEQKKATTKKKTIKK